VRIALVDYGAGNLPSVERAFARLGASTTRVTSPAGLSDADAIVLPGVGHFAALMSALSENGLDIQLRQAIRSGVPFLGICLGLQALFDTSEEAPGLAGLGVLPGRVCALPGTAKLPHMGWNQLRRIRASRLLCGISEAAWFYFAHSYAAMGGGAHVAAVCEYGVTFASVVEQGNVMAVQFHPEKSGEAGARVLRNFVEAVR
jgi:imidazole glycerol phosphate synthase glutamine amidotransferase subunit